MKIDLFIPPAIDSDLGNTSGYLIRCKPADDCASLFSMSFQTTMYGDLNLAVEDARKHAERCPHEHAVVAVANNASLIPGDTLVMTRSALELGYSNEFAHRRGAFCNNCVPVKG